MSVALKILLFLATNKSLVDGAINGAQSMLDHLPGDSKAAVVRDFIREAMDMKDEDDKSWEKAWRIVRPFFDAYVAKIKGTIVAVAAAAA